MEDFYFEEELKKKCEDKGKNVLNNRFETIEYVKKGHLSQSAHDAILEFDSVLDEFLCEKYEPIFENMNIEELVKQAGEFFDFEPLKSLYSKLDLEDDMEYFKWATVFSEKLDYKEKIDCNSDNSEIKNRVTKALLYRMLDGECPSFPSLRIVEKMLSECGADFGHDSDCEKKAEDAIANYSFSQEEEEYIKLEGLTANINEIKEKVNLAMFQILISSKLREYFDEETLLEIKDFMNTSSKFKEYNYAKTKAVYGKILSGGIVDQDIHEKLEAETKREIEENAEYYSNDLINCGGYAFKIDTCIYPRGNLTFNQNISGLLDKFPFVRLLGNTQLEDDEYMVIYRAAKENARGHHFIRVDSDGIVRDKDGNGEPRIFKGWGDRLSDLENNEEAIFAVKKDHKMFGYDAVEVNGVSENELDFSQVVDKAIKEKTNIFTYHSQTFVLKKDDNNIYVGLSGGDIVATVSIENEECKTTIYPEKVKNVENLSGNITPIIKDGKLQNFDEFIGRKSPDLDDDAR